MKIKPVGKIVIIIVICVGAFFVIKKYQSSHPSSSVVIKSDTTVVKSVDTVAIAKPKDTINAVSAQPKAAARIPAHEIKKQTETKDKSKKKGEGRENLKLENF